MNTIYIWGIKFNPLSKLEIVNLVQQWLESGRKGIHITGVNPEQVTKVQTNSFMKKALNDSDIVNIDGILIVQILRLYGYKIPERAATPDIFELLLKEADKKKQDVFFLGGEKTVLRKMIENVIKDYPGINIVGYRDGFYSVKEEKEIVEQISLLSPSYLFLGLPSPQKEEFIMKYKNILNTGCCYGVGGAFDIKGEKVFRAPVWGQKLGLEWAFRILQAPRNYGKRVLKYYTPFLYLFFKSLFLRDFYKKE